MGNSSSSPVTGAPPAPGRNRVPSQRRRPKSDTLDSDVGRSIRRLALEAEEDQDVPGGTLRGAMQGRAEHVVYGPRRVDGIAPPVVSREVEPPSRASNSPVVASVPLPVTEPEPVALKEVIDPDDTSHASYATASRLTSSVMSSHEPPPLPTQTVYSPPPEVTSALPAVDMGAGAQGVPTKIQWFDDEREAPTEVFVTGTFAKGWKTKIQLHRTADHEFSVLISLPPGPHRLKFIVDKEWKASKHLPAATDADGNLINYVKIVGPTSIPSSAAPPRPTPFGTSPSLVPPTWNPSEADPSDTDRSSILEDAEWTSEIPEALLEWGEWEALRETYELALEADPTSNAILKPPPAFSSIPPPSLPAQLEKGPLNHAAYVTQGSGDDNSILPKPDHSVINHLAASPIKGGFLSVGVTTRYKRKFVTIVYYKALST